MMRSLKPIARAAVRIGRRWAAPPAPCAAEVEHIRSLMGEQVLDCELKAARRVRAHLDSARSVTQLWLLRAEIYQAVAEQFGQPEAMRRMAQLALTFEGRLPRRRHAR